MKKEVKGITPQACRAHASRLAGECAGTENTLEFAVAMTPLDMITEEFVLQTKNSVPQTAPQQETGPQMNIALNGPVKSYKDAAIYLKRIIL